MPLSFGATLAARKSGRYCEPDGIAIDTAVRPSDCELRHALGMMVRHVEADDAGQQQPGWCHEARLQVSRRLSGIGAEPDHGATLLDMSV